MKAHTSTFKDNIKLLGREIDSKITYELDGETIELGNETLNSITPHYEADILKSVMKQLDIDSNVDIPIGTEINYQFGLKVGNSYEYLDYGNYIIYSSEKQEDTRSYKIVAYDKMLYAMKDYQALVSKNLLPNNSITQTKNGVTYTVNQDNSITLNGTSTGAFIVEIASGLTLEAGTYTLSLKGKIQGCGIYAYTGSGVLKTYVSSNNTPDNWKTNFTLDSDTTFTQIRIDVQNNKTFNNVTIYPMIEKGSQATNYVPYFNDYPISIKSYLSILADNIGLTLKDTNFINYDKELTSELYLDSEGNSLNYTYRDVLDEIAGATASTICINEDDELEVRYITDTTSENLYNYNDTNGRGSTDRISVDDEGWITAHADNTSGTGTMWCNWFTNKMNIKDSSDYTIVMEVKNVESETTNNNQPFIMVTQNFSASLGQFKEYSAPQLRQLTNNTTYIYQVTSKANQDSLDNMGMRSYVSFQAGTKGTITFRFSVFEGHNITQDNFYYQPFNGDTINEEYLKDINVNFGEKYGPVNSIVFSRSAESDNIYRKDDDSIEANGLTEIKIVDNQILNSNTRDDFIEGVFNQLNGFEYYANDFTSTGITYYDVCDRYNVKVEDKFYSCVMLNDELDVTQGLEEKVHTDIPEQSETDYKKADKML